jgi:UDP-N-acetylmuramate dehydrogenase
VGKVTNPIDTLVAAGRARPNAELAPLTTYKLGGPARWLVEAASEEDVVTAARAATAVGVDLLVLGRGSNLVIADSGFNGLVIRLVGGLTTVELEPSGDVRAGAGASLPVVARHAARWGRGGLEFFVGVPGSVGGAVRMNAGCHGRETVDVLLDARVVDVKAGTVEDRPAESLGLGYRNSALGPTDVVIGARFKTEAGTAEAAEAEMRQVTRWRRLHQPGGTLNAGSVFANPPGDTAGRIIDHLGLKGFRVGGAAVSTKHANFFVAGAGATAQDVHDLVWAVRRRVGDATGVWLRPEIRFAGEFASSTDDPTDGDAQ